MFKYWNNIPYSDIPELSYPGTSGVRQHVSLAGLLFSPVAMAWIDILKSLTGVYLLAMKAIEMENVSISEKPAGF